jgi:hypothetical protein
MTKQACGVACLVAAIGSWTAARADDAAASSCAVEIARAPDDARAAIARWVAEEPRCGAPLTVRVVATTDGLYVLAQDADGRQFERVVPDADAAGVLVASWAARVDDRAPAGAPVAAPMVAPVAAAAGPGEPVDGGPAAPAGIDVWRRRWVEVAAVAREHDAVGATVTGRYELSRGGRWSVGLAGAAAMLSAPLMGPTGMTERVSLEEASAALQGAWTLRLAPWRVRAELDLGIAGTRIDVWSASAQVHAAVEIGRPVGGRWGVFARGEALTRARQLGETLKYATDFTNDTHWLGLVAGVATSL